MLARIVVELRMHARVVVRGAACDGALSRTSLGSVRQDEAWHDTQRAANSYWALDKQVSAIKTPVLVFIILFY